MKVGIVRFPGSNCDFDALKFFRKFGHLAEFIWYKETKFRNYNFLVLPGGFAFGDRVYKKATGKYVIDPGEQALKSPVMKMIRQAAKQKIPIWGICNGFQILVKAKLLPGRLEQNDSKMFVCNWTECLVKRPFFKEDTMVGKVLKIPVAHGHGKFSVSAMEYKQLVANGQIFLEYKSFNPNGSFKNIAGVCNLEKNIFGMMPHPERTMDGKYFMQAIEKYV